MSEEEVKICPFGCSRCIKGMCACYLKGINKCGLIQIPDKQIMKDIAWALMEELTKKAEVIYNPDNGKSEYVVRVAELEKRIQGVISSD